MPMNCPKCGTDISESYEPDDYSCGIVAGWSCDSCGIGFAEHEYPRELLPDDVPIMTDKEAHGDRPLGTPLSELSGRPGPKDDIGHPDHARYENFKRIARSWGYD